MSDFTNDLRYPKAGSLLFDTKDRVDVEIRKDGSARSMTAIYSDPETGEVIQTSEGGGGAEMSILNVTIEDDGGVEVWTIPMTAEELFTSLESELILIRASVDGFNQLCYPASYTYNEVTGYSFTFTDLSYISNIIFTAATTSDYPVYRQD